MKGVKKVLRFIGYLFIGVISSLIIFLAVSIKPVDRTDYHQKDFYSRMQTNLKVLDELRIPSAQHNFFVGFAKENITPPFKTSMAGSGLRKIEFKDVHDSIYVRTMVISNGTETVSLVSLDLLIVPPAITSLLEKELTRIGFSLDNTFLSATHTHSSIGNWGEHLAGTLYSGPYNDSLIHFITGKIIKSVVEATRNKTEATLKSGSIPVSGLLYNRLVRENGTVDSLMRVIEINRLDGQNLLLCSFTGHPTCDKSSSLSISRDYPGVLIDKLEMEKYSFAMFVAGAVGSHSCSGPERGHARINFVGERLAAEVLQRHDSLKPVNDSLLLMIRIPLELNEPQLKVSKDWRIRPWLFRSVFGTYPSYLTALRIGDIVMLGTPCDFSGELTPAIDAVANQHGLRAMVTSFNGTYIGYITLDKHYDVNHYETRLMNWYGPGNGSYLSECMIEMLEALSRQ